jgi:hypothetical protein
MSKEDSQGLSLLNDISSRSEKLEKITIERIQKKRYETQQSSMHLILGSVSFCLKYFSEKAKTLI